jgi:hypothetical protein
LDPFRHHYRATFWLLVTPATVAGAGPGPGPGAGRPGRLRRGISVDHGCRLRPVSGTARGVLASRLVSAVQQPKTITRLSRQSRGQGTVELSRLSRAGPALRPVAERHGVTPAAVAIAIAWTLSFPGATGAIVGARRPGQVDGWLPAATLELKDDDLADIAAAVRATAAGTGPASPSSFFAAPRRQQGASWAQPEAQPRVS